MAFLYLFDFIKLAKSLGLLMS